MTGEFDKPSSPSTPEYRANWDRVFRPAEPPVDSRTLAERIEHLVSPLDGDTGRKHPHTFTAQEGRIIDAVWRI